MLNRTNPSVHSGIKFLAWTLFGIFGIMIFNESDYIWINALGIAGVIIVGKFIQRRM